LYYTLVCFIFAGILKPNPHFGALFKMFGMYRSYCWWLDWIGL